MPGFKINPGDTVFETLDQLARAQGVFLTTDGEGRLVLARAGKEKAKTVLEFGKKHSGITRIVQHGRAVQRNYRAWPDSGQ